MVQLGGDGLGGLLSCSAGLGGDLDSPHNSVLVGEDFQNSAVPVAGSGDLAGVAEEDDVIRLRVPALSSPLLVRQQRFPNLAVPSPPSSSPLLP